MLKREEDRVTLDAEGQFELARSAGFDTYDDFCQWREQHPDEYERWYQDVVRRAAESDS